MILVKIMLGHSAQPSSSGMLYLSTLTVFLFTTINLRHLNRGRIPHHHRR